MRWIILILLVAGCSETNNNITVVHEPPSDRAGDFLNRSLFVSGSGDCFYNGEYTVEPFFNGNPQWKHQQDEIYIRWIGTAWAIVDPGGIAYESPILLTEDGAQWQGVGASDPGPAVEYYDQPVAPESPG